MAKKTVLDAMIKRADFAERAEDSSQESFLSQGLGIGLSHLESSGQIIKFLRKPDFQRETNHWSPDQVTGLIKSFISGDLIPSLILWRSAQHIFVIDGAHRLSALIAWVNDDYGDGPISHTFFSGIIPEDQSATAQKTKKLVNKEVGTYASFRGLTEEQLSSNLEKAKQHNKMFSSVLNAQWVVGDREVAEKSFFKINSQGTTLDQTEELLLTYRKKPYAIAARSIVRAGTGHKYWSAFSEGKASEIEELALKQNRLLFQPSITEPIKTLDLPISDARSPVDALSMLIEIFTIVDGEKDSRIKLKSMEDDLSGEGTIATLKKCYKVTARISGNGASSLGLHPAVYFYTEKGKHSRFLFLGAVKAVSEKISNNNKQWFKDFTNVRGQLESILISRKGLINMGLANVNSKQRIDRIANLLDGLVSSLIGGGEVDDAFILEKLGLKGDVGDLRFSERSSTFSDDTKSGAFIRDAISSGLKCRICGGLLHTIKSVSYDHVKPASKDGDGSMENSQLLHPFCNTGIKGDSVE